MNKKYYLAYGSNLNLNQVKERCINIKPIGSIVLKDYRLVYKGSADNFAYLTLEKSNGDSVPLGLFELSSTDIYFLDIYEGYPTLYSKHYIPIEIENKKIKALIYIMNKGFDYHIPSSDYIETCIQGYDDFGFDKSILEQALIDTTSNLSKIKTNKKSQS